ncbi:hypothetical protein [Sulfitobacter geojensis]
MGGRNATDLTNLPGAANAQTTAGDFDTSGISDMVLGNPDAEVAVV